MGRSQEGLSSLRAPIGLLGLAVFLLGARDILSLRSPLFYADSESAVVDATSINRDSSSAASPIIDELLSFRGRAAKQKQSGDDTSARAIYQILRDLEGISHRTGSHPEELMPDPKKQNRADVGSRKYGRGGREIIVVRNKPQVVPESPALTTGSTKFALDDVLMVLSRTPLGNPTDAPLSSGFGWRSSPFRRANNSRFHSGLDYSVDKYSPVWATADGVVSEAGNCGAYGNCIVVDHGNGYETLYAHLSRFNVEVGASVCRSQAIGQIGSSGRSTGPHLHYEVRKNGVPINPVPFVEAAKLLAIILGEILI